MAATLAILAACTMVPAAEGNAGGSMVNDGQQFSMHPGEQVTLADHGNLRYVRVVNDSRCPPGVKCIWAGDAEVAFEWTPATGTMQAFSLHTGKDPKQQATRARQLTLVSLERGATPQAQLRVDMTR